MDDKGDPSKQCRPEASEELEEVPHERSLSRSLGARVRRADTPLRMWFGRVWHVRQLLHRQRRA